jgi:calcium/calmodulin-dependent protein kinase I
MSKDDDDADVKLVDFGFADIAENDSSLSGLLGTPAYMAPEIWSSKPYGKPVDMWSFGVITYILLGGYPPFSDDRKERLARRIQTGTFEFHLQYWGNVSDEAKDFITKLLQIDTSKRLTVNQALQHSWVSYNHN